MTRTISIILFLLIILGIFFSASLDWLRSWGRTALGPVAPVTGAVTHTRGFFESLREVGSLRAELASAQTGRAQAEARVSELQEKLNRVARSDEELSSLAESGRAQMISARVVGRSPLGTFDELILDQGSDEEVRLGAPVLKAGHLIGVISKVSARTAVVRLVTSAQSAIPVVLQESRAQGILRGGLAGLVVTDLPIDVTLTEGETILTSPLGDLVLADIPIGRTGAVLSAGSEILKRVKVASPVRFSAIEEVLIRRLEAE